MLSARKRKKLLYSGINAPLAFAVLDAMIRNAYSPQDEALKKLKEILSQPEQMAVLTRMKDK